MIEVCDPVTLVGKRDRLILVLGYALYARWCELSDLHIEDVEQTGQGLKILVRASRTDQDAQGEYVPVKTTSGSGGSGSGRGCATPSI